MIYLQKKSVLIFSVVSETNLKIKFVWTFAQLNQSRFESLSLALTFICVKEKLFWKLSDMQTSVKDCRGMQNVVFFLFLFCDVLHLILTVC